MIDSTVVYVVDDDASTRKSLGRLIRASGYTVETFDCADDFLSQEHTKGPSCLILDIRMPGLNGLELQDRLVEMGSIMPIIFVTGHASVSLTVRAMKAGAVELLEKPFDDKSLLEAIRLSIGRSKEKIEERKHQALIQEHVQRLTPRETEVFELVVTGLLNKQVARKLEISEKPSRCTAPV